MNFSQGHSGTKVRYVNRACFPKEKHQNLHKMGEIHELFVLALSLVWFAGATVIRSFAARKNNKEKARVMTIVAATASHPRHKRSQKNLGAFFLGDKERTRSTFQ